MARVLECRYRKDPFATQTLHRPARMSGAAIGNGEWQARKAISDFLLAAVQAG